MIDAIIFEEALMDIVTLLEVLTTKVHHTTTINELIDKQCGEIKASFLTNDAERLKRLISDFNYLANTSHVVQVNDI